MPLFFYYDYIVCNMYIPSTCPNYVLGKYWHIHLVVLGCKYGIHHTLHKNQP